MKKHMDMVERRLEDGLELWHEVLNDITVIAKWLKWNGKSDRFFRVPMRCDNIEEAEKWSKRLERDDRNNR